MANGTETRTEMELFDALIAGTLTDLIEEDVTDILTYALYRVSGLQYAAFPNLTQVRTYSMQNADSLEVLDIGSKISTMESYCFDSCDRLNSLILRSDEMSSLGSSNRLSSTPISRRLGGVFVPSDLVNTYKSNTYWKNYNIYPIDEYPKAVWESIQDSWAQIEASVLDGSYKTKYALGDTKAMDMGDEVGIVIMQIVAFDADTITGGGTAAITWMALNLLPVAKAMNQTATNANGYFATNVMRPYVESLKAYLPTEVKRMLVAVDKTSYNYTTSGDRTDSFELWIPSAREVLGGTSYEASGPSYSSVLSNVRVKSMLNTVSANVWWLRTAHTNSSYFRYIGTSGSISYGTASTSNGVCLGFCTGETPETPET